MAIYKNMPMYRQVGGPTIPNLPGVGAHEELNRQIEEGAGTPVVDPTKTPEDLYKDIVAIEADPRSQPDYYGGATVAEFDPSQLESFRQREAAATETNRLNQLRLGEFESQLDPTSEYNKRLQDIAQGAAGRASSQQGLLGSTYAQDAAARASQDAYIQSRDTALQGITGVQGDLTAGADILSGVGKERLSLIHI